MRELIQVINAQPTQDGDGVKIHRLTERSTLPILIDMQLVAGDAVELAFNTENPALVYIYQGSTKTLNSCQLGIYASGTTLKIKAEKFSYVSNR